VQKQQLLGAPACVGGTSPEILYDFRAFFDITVLTGGGAGSGGLVEVICGYLWNGSAYFRIFQPNEPYEKYKRSEPARQPWSRRTRACLAKSGNGV
jgi:hypothetical protein